MITDIQCQNSKEGAVLYFLTKGDPTFHLSYRLETPPKIYVLTGEPVYTNLPEELTFGEGTVRSVRIERATAKVPSGLGSDFYRVKGVLVTIDKTKNYDFAKSFGLLKVNIGSPSKLELAKPVQEHHPEIVSPELILPEAPAIEEETVDEEEIVDKEAQARKEAAALELQKQMIVWAEEVKREKEAKRTERIRREQASQLPLILGIDAENDLEKATVSLKITEAAKMMLYASQDSSQIMLDPTQPLYTNVERGLSFYEGLIDQVIIMKSGDPLPDMLDSSYYPVEMVIVKLRKPSEFKAQETKGTINIALYASEEEIQYEDTPKPAYVSKSLMPAIVPQAEQEDVTLIQEDVTLIKDVSVIDTDRGRNISVTANKKMPCVYYQIDNPPRLILDPPYEVYTNLADIAYPDKDPIKKIKFIPSTSKVPEGLGSGYRAVDFISVALKEPAEFDFEQKGNEISIDFKKAKVEVKAKAEAKAEIKAKAEVKVGVVTISDIEKVDKDKSSNITVYTNTYCPYVTYQIQDPKRIIIDPLDTIYAKLKESYLFEKGAVELVRIVRHRDPVPPQLGEDYYAVDFIVVQLREDKPYTAFQSEDELTVAVGEAQDIVLPGEEGMISSGFLFEEKQKKAGGKGLGLDECIDIAIENHLPAKTAQEEVKLAKMKVWEARRAMMPAPTAKYTHTTGMAQGVKFRETRYGVQVEQPIYYSGRLRNTLKQAHASLNVASKKFDKIKADLSYNVSEQFFNLAASQENLKIQESLLDRSKESLDMAKKKYEKSLIREIEYLNVESQANQVLYQCESARKDLDLAKLKLQNIMGLEPGADLLIDTGMEHKKIAINLYDALEVAYVNRPDLLINALLVKVNEYEQKIAKGKDSFKIDATGFAGRSGSAYEGETLRMNSDWFIGLQASKILWGNTLAYSFSKDKTSPKLGETTRTETEAHNVELSVLNYLQGRSDIQTAKINYQKALNDYQELQRNIRYEVRDAFYNFEKSNIQLNNIATRILIKEKELKIVQAQSGLGEAEITQVLETHMKLVDEKVLYNKTLSDYLTAIANLNKAVGVSGYYN